MKALPLLSALVFVGACVDHHDDHDGDRDREDRQSCSTDTDCGRGDVCGPPGVCLAPDEIRSVEVAWTIAGKPADESTCGRGRGLALQFRSDPEPGRGEALRFDGVRCAEGRFVMDRLPWKFWVANLETSVTGSRSGIGLPIDGRRPTVIDLPY